MTIKKHYLVEKRNVLNEIRTNNMTLQELRFFSIYLAKINARNISTRKVRFQLEDFMRIMDFEVYNLTQLKETFVSLMSKVVEIPTDDGGFVFVQLFRKIKFGANSLTGWHVEIDAHDDALPYMFEFKERYFTYELWIALRLKSSNQFRMYEILKQYEGIGKRVINLSDLRGFLGIRSNEYVRFDNFKKRVLDACQEALEKYTDITFTYEVEKRGERGKVISLIFHISRNENYVDQLSLDKFIDKEDLADILSLEELYPTYEKGAQNYFNAQIYPFISEACEHEFAADQMQVLYNMIIAIIPIRRQSIHKYILEVYDYLKRKHDELKLRNNRKDLNTIKNRYGYIKKLVEADFEKASERLEDQRIQR